MTRSPSSQTDPLAPSELERFARSLPIFAEVPDEELRFLLTLVRPVRLSAGEYFLREGDMPGRIGYVAQGLFRVFFVTEDGEERTMAFRGEGRLLAGYTSSIEQTAAKYSIVALEDSLLLATPLEMMPTLMKRHRCWTELFLRYAQLLFIEKEQRERDFLSLDAEGRYAAFRERYPGLEERIPQYLIASFLGINPVSLSRLRRKMGAR